MSDQFICISCWKEFTVNENDIDQRGGKVVCPNCGYIQPLPANFKSKNQTSKKLENAPKQDDKTAEVVSWENMEKSASDDEENAAESQVEILGEDDELTAERTDEIEGDAIDDENTDPGSDALDERTSETDSIPDDDEGE